MWIYVLAFLVGKRKALCGDHFRICGEDYPALYQLLVYMRDERAEAERLGICLRKGILLTGPIGCWRTSLMTQLHFLRGSAELYPITSSREVSFALHRGRYEVIRRYSRAAYSVSQPAAHLFVDLGSESSLK